MTEGLAYLLAGEPLAVATTARTEFPRDSRDRSSCAAAPSKQGDELAEDAVAALVSFFGVLERWDQEAQHDVEIV